MREIIIISGKGGTGKTSLTAAFADLSEDRILCDLDVDAPDLHILLQPETVTQEDFFSGHEAHIDPDLCTGCGTCMDMCRYGAVSEKDGVFGIDPLRCEGCKVCVEFCPAGAVEFPIRHCGTWSSSNTRFGPMIHAQLFPGEENSGLLVARLKQEARKLAEEKGLDMLLCDGAPGIGCPVIASLSGTDLAVVVTEPTPSGRHDLERVGELCEHFRTKVAVIVNKCDLNPDQAASIRTYCQDRGYSVIAELPHDNIVTQAMVQRKAVTELPGCPFSHALRQAWQRIEDLSKTKQPEKTNVS